MSDKLKPGMKLWLVPENGRQKPREVVVESVGRKWAKIAGDVCNRIEIDTMIVYSAERMSAKVYADRSEYERELADALAWGGLMLAIRNRYGKPKGVTAEDVAAARKLLRLDESES